MPFIIKARHPTAGDAEVLVDNAGYSIGTHLSQRARLVKPGYGLRYKTGKGAERTLAKVRGAVAGNARWDGYALSVEEMPR
jgi:hypothetical protein